jgi:NADPH:quinone reductase-like Zn-dependent oxidoreductase
MKAIVYESYGSPDVLKCEEIAKPTPGDDEVLLKVRAASLNPLDSHLMHGGPFLVRALLSLRGPRLKRPGVDVAGEVEAVGKNVSQFKPGDKVFGSCRGAFAEYACPADSRLALKPDNVSFEQAASVPVAAYTALQGLRDRARIQPGQKILVNGAAGGVGTFVVQIAKWLGAEVTGVCSTRNVEMVRSIGADRAIDYTKEDFTKGGPSYDVIFDLVANHSLSACRRVLHPKGIYIVAGGLGASIIDILTLVIRTRVLSPFVSQKFIMLLAKSNQDDLKLMRQLMEAGKVTPVIDRCYQLSEVSNAIRYLEEKHAQGKIVITVQ